MSVPHIAGVANHLPYLWALRPYGRWFAARAPPIRPEDDVAEVTLGPSWAYGLR